MYNTLQMISSDLSDLLNQVVKLAPFPHAWNDFQLMKLQDKHALFRKLTNEQYFPIPLVNITAKRPAEPGEPAELTLDCKVDWKKDDTGYGYIWAVVV
jgi:hypothetical protein